MNKDIQTIRGGWKNVPEGWHTKTQLNKMGLKPIANPVGEVWSYHDWVNLYDINYTKEKIKPTDKQLAALARARNKKIELENQRTAEEIRKREVEFKKEQEKHKNYWINIFRSWYERDFVILDTESTDLDGEIIEIAIIDKNGKILFNSLVNPKTDISRDAFHIHGISKAMLTDQPTWPEIFIRIKEIIKDKLILIYNADFDVSMINNSCYLWGLKPPSLETNCVMRSYASFWLTRWVSLSESSESWTSHRALDDCLDTLKVIKALWEECGIGVNEYN